MIPPTLTRTKPNDEYLKYSQTISLHEKWNLNFCFIASASISRILLTSTTRHVYFSFLITIFLIWERNFQFMCLEKKKKKSTTDSVSGVYGRWETPGTPVDVPVLYPSLPLLSIATWIIPRTNTLQSLNCPLPSSCPPPLNYIKINLFEWFSFGTCLTFNI